MTGLGRVDTHGVSKDDNTVVGNLFPVWSLVGILQVPNLI